LRLTTSNFIFQLNTCGYSPYITSSLTRGFVCRLQLLLVLASAVILRSESHGTHDHILLSHIPDFPNLEGLVPIFISPRNRVTRLYPRQWVPFSSPPTTRRATVEVFEPFSTRDITLRLLTYLLTYSLTKVNVKVKVKVKVRVTLRLAVYRQSVLLGARPLDTHDQRYFFQLNSSINSPYVTSSLTRRWVYLL
jgi:hypothetical protein